MLGRTSRWLMILALGAGAPSLCAQPPGTSSSTLQRLEVDGRTRQYLVDLPPRYDRSRRYPLVLNFHGGGGSPNAAKTQSGFSLLGAREDVIVVYPAGTGRLRDDRLLTWNTVTCCGYAQRAKVDDVAFVRALLDRLEADYSIDSTRVYAIGLSNGGMMAHLVGCRLSDRFAAIAVISGELTIDDCAPQRPVSVLIIHGSADQNLPYEGGTGRKAIDPHDVRPVGFAVDSWRRVDRCPDTAHVTTTPQVQRSTWSPCANGTAVELYRIEGGGHAWPGGERLSRLLDAPSAALDATAVAWAFFAAHARH